MDYYIRIRGQVEGPYSAEQLQKLAARGRFARHYEVSTDRSSWLRAETRPELFPTPVAAPSPREQPAKAPIASAPAVTAPVPPEDTANAEQWHFSRGNQQLGPVAKAELQRLIRVGQVAVDDRVWIEGMENWQRVRDVPELARGLALASFGSPAPSPSSPFDVPSVAPLAIASLLFGLLGVSILPGLGSLLAIIFGHVALSQIHRSAGKLQGQGLAWTGLILGYLVLIPLFIMIMIYCAVVVMAATATAGLPY